MDVDIHAHIGNVYAVEDDAAGGRILHTIETAEQGRFAAAGGTENAHDVALVDGEIDPLQDLVCPKALFQVNYVDHFSRVPFP